MTDRELMQQMLDILWNAFDLQQDEISEHITKYGEWYRPQRVEHMKNELEKITQMTETLNARLAQPEPEPVAWFSKRPDNTLAIKIVGKPTEGDWEPLYTAPPQHEWQGLTDQEIDQGQKESWVTKQAWESAVWWAEAKLKEKNNA